MIKQKDIPSRAQYHDKGLFWRVDSANRVLRYNDFEWVSSTRSVESLKQNSVVNVRDLIQ